MTASPSLGAGGGAITWRDRVARLVVTDGRDEPLWWFIWWLSGLLFSFVWFTWVIRSDTDSVASNLPAGLIVGTIGGMVHLLANELRKHRGLTWRGLARRALLWWILGAAVEALFRGVHSPTLIAGSIIYGALAAYVYLVISAAWRGIRGRTLAQLNGPEVVVVETEIQHHPRRFLTARNYVLLLATIIVVAVAYYFLVSLPAHNRAILALEREKQAMALGDDLARRARRYSLETCIQEADRTYWEFVEMNGTKRKNGSLWALNYIWDHARENKQLALEACDRNYGR